MQRSVHTCLVLCALLSASASAESDLERRIRRVEEGLLAAVLIDGDPAWKLTERMAYHRVPGVSIAVFKDFRIDWAKGYGLLDNEAGGRVSTETLFQAGSISKPVAAAAALRLVEGGKIRLDEDINRRLRSWKLPDNEFTARQKVTLAHLLSHTAGLTVHGFPGYRPGLPIPDLTQVLDGKEPANTAPVRVDAEPGRRFRYSGGGTTIVQLALMDIEGKPFPEIARALVLDPIGMTRSTFEQPLPAELRDAAASGHKEDGRVVEGRHHVYPEMAAAGLWTTATDLAKFAIEVQLSAAGRSNRVLAKATVARMLTPFREGSPGLGFFLERKSEDVYFSHGGADEGFRAFLIAHTQKGYGAAVMVNSDNGRILGEIARAIAREYGWVGYLPAPVRIVRVSPEILRRYEGRYRAAADRVVTVRLEEGRLIAHPTWSTPFEMLPISESTFVQREGETRYTFRAGSGVQAESLLVTTDQGSFTAARMTAEEKIP